MQLCLYHSIAESVATGNITANAHANSPMKNSGIGNSAAFYNLSSCHFGYDDATDDTLLRRPL